MLAFSENVDGPVIALRGALRPVRGRKSALNFFQNLNQLNAKGTASFNEALRRNPGYKEAEENLRVAKAADAEIFPAAHR